MVFVFGVIGIDYGGYRDYFKVNVLKCECGGRIVYMVVCYMGLD